MAIFFLGVRRFQTFWKELLEFCEELALVDGIQWDSVADGGSDGLLKSYPRVVELDISLECFRGKTVGA